MPYLSILTVSTVDVNLCFPNTPELSKYRPISHKLSQKALPLSGCECVSTVWMTATGSAHLSRSPSRFIRPYLCPVTLSVPL